MSSVNSHLELGDFVYLKPVEECVAILEANGYKVTDDYKKFLRRLCRQPLKYIGQYNNSKTQIIVTGTASYDRLKAWVIDSHLRM